MGLIAPLWRRWPEHFHVLGLCVGASMPDIVDGIADIFRYHMGQWYGHSLVGLLFLCWPFGLVLTAGAVAIARRLVAYSGARCMGDWLRLAGRSLLLWDRTAAGAGTVRRAVIITYSVWLGALSHILFDLISHSEFLLLAPWYEGPSVLPSWWLVDWWDIPLPGYEHGYPFGPHLIMWFFLSILGTIMLFLPAIRARRAKRACRRR